MKVSTNIPSVGRESKLYSRVATSSLSVHGHPNVRAAVLSGALHVLVMDHAGEAAAHLVVDARAQPIARLPDLHLAITWAEGCEDEMLVTGEDAQGRAMLVSIDSAGSERWRAPLAVGAFVTQAPRALWADGRAIAVWEETEDDKCVLLVSAVRAGTCDPPQRFALPSVTHKLELVLTSAGLVVARLSGFAPHCSMLRLDQNGNLTGVEVDQVNAGPMAMAPTAVGVALAWAEGLGVSVRHFDTLLRPVSDSDSLSIPSGAVNRLCGYGPGRPAFVATARKEKPGTRGALSTEKARSHVLLDGCVLDVPSPVGWIEAGGWLGETFVLIHGDGLMAASAFSVIADSGGSALVQLS